MRQFPILLTVSLALTTLTACDTNSAQDSNSIQTDSILRGNPISTTAPSQAANQNTSTATDYFAQTDNTTDNLCCDSTFKIFNDDSYFVSFNVLKPKNGESESHLGRLTLNHKVANNIALLLCDTLEFAFPNVELRDMNNDRIRDILINNSSSARSVWTQHLYLVDNKNHELKRVKNFEEVYDPSLDTTNNIISSVARYSCVHYYFYRITKDDKLINLGNDYEDCLLNDSSDTMYSNAVKNIRRQYK